MRILGVDPGNARAGYGLLESEGKTRFLDCGVIECNGATQSEKLKELGERFRKLIETTRPEAAGIERLFFSRNQKTALAVAEARGVLILILTNAGIPIYEYTPRAVKESVCGYGLADKRAVATMVYRILRIPDLLQYDDATDALAIALTTVQAIRYNKRVGSA